MAVKPTLTTFSLLLFSLISLSTSLPSESILNGVDTLANSNYIAMSLLLQLTADTILTAQFRTATIFSPSDTAFYRTGQPTLALLQYHFSPVAFSVESLQSLSYGTKLPTMYPGKSLTVTSQPSVDQVSINGVKISTSPIFDDGSLVIFGTESFFEPNFTLPVQITSPSVNTHGCLVYKGYPRRSIGDYSFREASNTLRSRGYTVMASFLDLQLLGFLGQPRLTVLAPVDEVMLGRVGDIPEYSSLFLRHVIPCRLTWTDLANVKDGTELHTYLGEFDVIVTVSNDVFMVNEVEITFPDMYYSEWLVVHGVRQILVLPESTEEGGEDDEAPGDLGGDEQGQNLSTESKKIEF